MNEPLTPVSRVLSPTSGIQIELNNSFLGTASPNETFLTTTTPNSVDTPLKISHVHSFIRDFTHRVLDRSEVPEVFEHVYGEISPPQYANRILELSKVFGIDGSDPKLVREEITNLLEWYFKETSRVLPESWPFSTFCEHLLDFQPLKELQTIWLCFFWYGEGSTFWEIEALSLYDRIWEAELTEPDSPLSDPDSPLVGADSPQSVLSFSGLPVEAGPANDAGLPGVGGPGIDLASPLDPFSIHPIIPLALGLGLFLVLFFFSCGAEFYQLVP